ncbi:MAG TPA: LysR substrate-binding domain-containing protein, partial [Burkholderiales bacterium]|nr:LysR substrate-binding domain-containing protein [Burkholderiales bacterium]
DRCLERHGVSPNIVMETNSNDAALATVRNSRLATISTLHSFPAMSDLKAVRLADPDLRRDTGILWRRAASRTATAMLMAEMIRKSYAVKNRGG